MRRHFDWGLAAAIALTLPIAAPFLTGQLPMTADAMLHLHRMVSAGLSIENGIYYPRWAPHLHAGFGYPLHNFYTPLWHMIGGGLYVLFDFRAEDLWLAAQTAGVVLCGPGAYLFARTFASRPAALAAAAAYTWVPIRFREIWDQGNVSQLIGMALIAWGFWGIARLVQHPTPRRAAVAALLSAALILTHHPTAFYFLPVLGLYTVLAGALAEDQRLKRITIGVAAYALGLIVATVYWLPSLAEVQYTQLDNSISAAFDIRNHFKDLPELLGTTPWLDRTALAPYRPLNIGFMQVFLAGLGLLAGIFARKLNMWQRGHAVVGGLALLFTIFLMTEPSVWLWENIPLAERLSFPWRLLGMAALLTVPGIAILVDSVKQRELIAISAIVLIVVSILPAAYPKGDYFPAFDDPVTAADAQRYELIGVLGMTGENEYLPRWTDFQNRPISQPDYERYENLDWYFTYWPASVPENASITQRDSAIHSSGERFTIETEQPFDLQLRQMYFPGWQAKLDGNEIEIDPTGDQGLATIAIPAGAHTLEVWYGGTDVQQVSLWISGFGLLICVVLLFFGKVPNVPAEPAGRFVYGVIGLAVGWLLFNQLYLIPQTEWFRPAAPITEPLTMETATPEQFFQPGIGFRLALLGYTLEQDELAPGNTLEITLYWRALAAFDGQPRLNLSLMSPDQSEVYAQVSTASLGGIAVDNWNLDQYVIQPLRLDIADDIPPTLGQLRVRVFDNDNGAWPTAAEADSLVIGEWRIDGDGWEVARGQSVDAEYGDFITLHNINLTDDNILELYWETTADVDRAYTLFLHYQQDGQTIAQADQPPLGINYPTSFWREGDRVISRIQLEPPEEADELLIGLYDTIRLPLRGTNAPTRDDGLILDLP